jgi:2-isopropylmalate synthase
MASMPATKYRPFPVVDLPDRTWPERALERAPVWCSVDLRDGNQALVEPMGPERKRRLFALLVEVGFREIEVGFPAASETEWAFLRELIESGGIPEDVTVQVLTQAREDLIERTFEAIRGAPRAIVHLYNSTSELQRRVVFGMDRAGIVEVAVRGAEQIRALAERHDGEVCFEYSPESFSATEMDFAVEICEAVMDVWEPLPGKPVILNLPSTVEMATPNVYADQVHVRDRDALVLSLHPHNDRGTAVAAAELALMAGADRVEGTLFGNGERTGNVDLVTLALNLYTQGVDPELAFWELDRVVEVAEHCTRVPVHPRHPYAGELVYTAFSGSHQDAIRKGMAALAESRSDHWEVPYLPIDPQDVGRSYEAVIRINSQSGKGGVAWVMEQDHGLRLPRAVQVEFARAVQALADEAGGELTSRAVGEAFRREYLERVGPVAVLGYEHPRADDAAFRFVLKVDGRELRVRAEGTGPVEALARALRELRGVALRVVDYSEHALGEGAGARAAAFVEAEGNRGRRCGVGVDGDIAMASLKALVNACNRLEEAV